MTISPVVIPAPPAALHWAHPAVPGCSSAFSALEDPCAVDHLDASSSSPSARTESMTASEWHILVVDDEPDIRMMLRVLLQDEGYQVSEAADGMIALGHLRASSRPVIVLLDYKMPRMNGEELLKAIMADPHLADRDAVIFVTANLLAFSPALHQLLAAAGIPVVQKPFGISQILEAIEQAIMRLRPSPDLPVP